MSGSNFHKLIITLSYENQETHYTGIKLMLRHYTRRHSF